MYEKFIKPLYSFCKSYILYVFVFFSIAILVIAYTCFNETELFRDVLKTLGFTIISGGVFAVIVKSEQFSKIFQDELRKIVYGQEDLKVRNDLESLWQNVTLALCKQKFKNISEKLHESIKNFYLPITQEYYYKNHNIEIEVEIDKENSEYVVVTETTTTTLYSDDLKPITLKFSSSIPMVKGEEELTIFELLEFKINKVSVDLTNCLKINREDGVLSVNCEIKVQDKLEYKIIRKEKKRYNLIENSYRHHRAIWLYENFFLELTYPKELKVQFIESGVMDKWNQHLRPLGKDLFRLKADYQGLIFRKQGFILLLNKI